MKNEVLWMIRRGGAFAKKFFFVKTFTLIPEIRELRSSLKHRNFKIAFEKSIFKIDLFEQKALFDPKMNWFLPKTDTTRTFFCERMT